MERVVVHVTTLDQWKSVLDVWFEQGYTWADKVKDYHEHIFKNSGRFLYLKDYITWSVFNKYNHGTYMEYEEFMKEANKMKTYYVTKKQLDLIEELKNLPCPLVAIMQKDYGMVTLYDELPLSDREWLRYLGGDETIEFKVKEPLYRLWRIDSDGERVYMKFSYGTPTWITDSTFAFTAPLDEIKKWKTPAWEIEEAK